jgi:DNA-binding transcriptional regulator YiaG
MKLIVGTNHSFIDESGRVFTDFNGPLRERKYYLSKGYRTIGVVYNGKVITQRISGLVAEAFVARPFGENEVCHRNDIKTDDRADNLYWGTHSDNMKDAYRNGRLVQHKKVSDQQVKEIRCMANCETTRSIARQYDISQSHVSDIINGKKRATGAEVLA